jgi:hypothetical protein
MSSSFDCGTSYFYVSNRRFFALISLAIEVAQGVASTTAEHTYIAKLKKFDEESFPGIGLDLDEFFTELDERKFWSEVFLRLAWEFYDRQRGNHDHQGRHIIPVIAQCFTICRMLEQLVNQTESGWTPLPAPEDDRPGPFRFKGLP